MCLRNDLNRYAPTIQASCWTRMKFHRVTWEDRLCKIGKNNFINTLVEAKTRNGKSWSLGGFRVWGFRVGVCVCLKLFLFAACTALPAGVRACILAWGLSGWEAKKSGAEMATTKVQRIMTQPIVRSSSFHLFFLLKGVFCMVLLAMESILTSFLVPSSFYPGWIVSGLGRRGHVELFSFANLHWACTFSCQTVFIKDVAVLVLQC